MVVPSTSGRLHADVGSGFTEKGRVFYTPMATARSGGRKRNLPENLLLGGLSWSLGLVTAEISATSSEAARKAGGAAGEVTAKKSPPRKGFRGSGPYLTVRKRRSRPGSCPNLSQGRGRNDHVSCSWIVTRGRVWQAVLSRPLTNPPAQWGTEQAPEENPETPKAATPPGTPAPANLPGTHRPGQWVPRKAAAHLARAIGDPDPTGHRGTRSSGSWTTVNRECKIRRQPPLSLVDRTVLITNPSTGRFGRPWESRPLRGSWRSRRGWGCACKAYRDLASQATALACATTNQRSFHPRWPARSDTRWHAQRLSARTGPRRCMSCHIVPGYGVAEARWYGPYSWCI